MSNSTLRMSISSSWAAWGAGGWCGNKVCGVRIIFRVFWRRPVACEPDVRHGDLVGIEGVGVGTLQLLQWDEMEADPVMEGKETRTNLVGDGLVDETVHDFANPLDGLDGCENGSMDVERAWSFGIGGDEPIEVDPHEVPDHGIDVVG